MDYYGFSYDVVEVNSVWRSEIKWSDYPKVPVLVCSEQPGHDLGPKNFVVCMIRGKVLKVKPILYDIHMITQKISVTQCVSRR